MATAESKAEGGGGAEHIYKHKGAFLWQKAVQETHRKPGNESEAPRCHVGVLKTHSQLGLVLL
jgi:hypothetical protein